MIQTPHIDRLAESGVSFRNAYIMGSSSPGVCLPSCASLLTGRTLWNIECQGIWGFEISEKFKSLRVLCPPFLCPSLFTSWALLLGWVSAAARRVEKNVCLQPLSLEKRRKAE